MVRPTDRRGTLSGALKPTEAERTGVVDRLKRAVGDGTLTFEEYIEPVLAQCYDSVEVNAPYILQPHRSLTVQLCYPVMTGALPQSLEGTYSMNGLSFAVAPTSVVGLWGGA
jgi:hypothetical protein